MSARSDITRPIMELDAKLQEPESKIQERQPVRRLPLLVGLLAVLLVVGAIQVYRSPWFHDRRLRRMGVAELQQWTAHHPDDAPAHLYLGLARQRSGKLHETAEEYVKALDLNPTLNRARSNLAGVLVMSGQTAAAEVILQQGVRIDPTYAGFYMGLGQIYEAREDFRRAVTAWEKATALAPGEAVAWFHLGGCWIGLNDEARALPAYERAATLEPLSVDYQKAFAGTLRLRGRYKEAEAHCRRAIQLRPDDPAAHFELMKVLRDRDGTTPQVEAEIQKAVSLQPGNPQFHYYLATVYQERTKLQQAGTEYITALQLYGMNRPRGLSAQWNDWSLWFSYLEGSHFNLARILKRLGHPKEAEQELAVYRRLSDYHKSANELYGVIANQPKNAALRFQLARVHAKAGFHELADEQYRAGQRLQQAERGR